MEHVRIDDLDNWMGPAAVKQPVGKALGTEDMALNYYELAPGESFAFGYHSHADQEEVFYITSGVATFETDDGDVDVEAGEAIRFAAGEFQQGFNRGNERVRALAIGAPAEAGELTLLRDCPDCESRTEHAIRPTEDKSALLTVCAECGVETARFS